MAFMVAVPVRPSLLSPNTCHGIALKKRKYQHAARTRFQMSIVTELLAKAIEASAVSLIGGTISPELKIPSSLSTPLRLPRDVEALCGAFEQFLKRLPSSLTPENNDRYVKLVICILVDLVGSGSLAVPLLGDALDLFCAPLIALVLQALYGSSFITIGGFTEELLPGTDAIPTATLAWIVEQMGYLEEWGWVPPRKKGGLEWKRRGTTSFKN